jgi:hypothetical protein
MHLSVVHPEWRKCCVIAMMRAQHMASIYASTLAGVLLVTLPTSVAAREKPLATAKAISRS